MGSGFSRCPQVQTGVWRAELRCRARLGSVQTPGGEAGKVNRKKKILPRWRVLTKVSSPVPFGNCLLTICPPLLAAFPNLEISDEKRVLPNLTPALEAAVLNTAGQAVPSGTWAPGSWGWLPRGQNGSLLPAHGRCQLPPSPAATGCLCAAASAARPLWGRQRAARRPGQGGRWSESARSGSPCQPHPISNVKS